MKPSALNDMLGAVRKFLFAQKQSNTKNYQCCKSDGSSLEKSWLR
jgi:hypothetical protein